MVPSNTSNLCVKYFRRKAISFRMICKIPHIRKICYVKVFKGPSPQKQRVWEWWYLLRGGLQLDLPLHHHPLQVYNIYTEHEKQNTKYSGTSEQGTLWDKRFVACWEVVYILEVKKYTKLLHWIKTSPYLSQSIPYRKFHCHNLAHYQHKLASHVWTCKCRDHLLPHPSPERWRCLAAPGSAWPWACSVRGPHSGTSLSVQTVSLPRTADSLYGWRRSKSWNYWSNMIGHVFWHDVYRYMLIIIDTYQTLQRPVAARIWQWEHRRWPVQQWGRGTRWSAGPLACAPANCRRGEVTSYVARYLLIFLQNPQSTNIRTYVSLQGNLR